MSFQEINVGTVANDTNGDGLRTAMQKVNANFLTSLAGSGGAAEVGYQPPGGFTARTVQDKLREVVSVTDFGAVGDGATDDSAAIQAADTYAAANSKTLYFPDGTYCAAELDQTTGWDMAPGAKILYNGATNGKCVTCDASNVQSGDIKIDGNAAQVSAVVTINGDDNRYGIIAVENVTSSTALARSVLVLGDRNSARGVLFKDLVNSGYASNNSSPQGLTVSGDAADNSFPFVFADTCQATVVDDSTSNNSYGEIHSVNAQDNGFYSVGDGSRASVDSIFYDGDDNAAGFREGANATIGHIHAPRYGSSCVFFGSCGDVDIGSIFVPNGTGHILTTNLADTGRINIGSIKGVLRNITPFFIQDSAGPVKYLTIGNVDLVVYIDDDWTFSTRSFVRLEACEGINLGNIKIDGIIADSYAGVDPWYVRINDALTYPSFIKSLRVAFFEDDEITPHSQQPLIIGFDGTNNQPLVQSQLQIEEGAITSSDNWLRQYTYSGYQFGRLIKDEVPASGPWRKGQIVWAENPTSSLIGWMCISAGTPGTWVILTIRDIVGTSVVDFTNTTDSATVEVLRLQGDRATPANNDIVHQSLYQSNSAGEQIETVRIASKLTAVADGSETSELRFSILSSGSLVDRLYVRFSKLAPTVNDSLALGSSSEQWADLFLAAGGEIRVNNVQMLDTVGGVSTQTAAATAIAAVGNAINTANKRAGKMVFDTTNTRLMVATGSAAADPWKSADGATTVTPA